MKDHRVPRFRRDGDRSPTSILEGERLRLWTGSEGQPQYAEENDFSHH